MTLFPDKVPALLAYKIKDGQRLPETLPFCSTSCLAGWLQLNPQTDLTETTVTVDKECRCVQCNHHVYRI